MASSGNHEIRRGLFGFSQPSDDSSHVTVQIPHRGIHLDHGHAEGTHRFLGPKNQPNGMILKQTIQRGRRERRSRGALLLVRRAAEATENKTGRLFQYHAGKKKRPQILGRTEDVIVRKPVRLIWRLRCLRMCAGG